MCRLCLFCSYELAIFPAGPSLDAIYTFDAKEMARLSAVMSDDFSDCT